MRMGKRLANAHLRAKRRRRESSGSTYLPPTATHARFTRLQLIVARPFALLCPESARAPIGIAGALNADPPARSTYLQLVAALPTTLLYPEYARAPISRTISKARPDVGRQIHLPKGGRMTNIEKMAQSKRRSSGANPSRRNLKKGTLAGERATIRKKKGKKTKVAGGGGGPTQSPKSLILLAERANFIHPDSASAPPSPAISLGASPSPERVTSDRARRLSQPANGARELPTSCWFGSRVGCPSA